MSELEKASDSPRSSLEEVFSSNSNPDSKESSEKEEKEESQKKEDDKPEGDKESEDKKSSPVRPDHPEDKKDDGEKDDKKKSDDKAPDKTSQEDKSDKKDEKKPDEKKDDQQKKDPWESEDNPYVKRYKDTASSWNKEHQENLQLRNSVQQLNQEVGVLKKIADGTYDPEKDDPQKQTRPEDIATVALNAGKGLASRASANREYGKEKVDSALAEFEQLFGNNDIVQSVVLSDESPVHAAIGMLDRYHFEQKYGSAPKDIYKSIREEYKKELEPEIRKQILAEIADRHDKAKDHPKGLSSSRGSSGLDKPQNSNEGKPEPLKGIFGK